MFLIVHVHSWKLLFVQRNLLTSKHQGENNSYNYEGEEVAVVVMLWVRSLSYVKAKNEVKKEGIDITEDMEKNIIKRLIDLELIYQQAKMDGLTSQSEFLSKSELAFKELIYTTYLQKFIKENKVSKKDIKKTYPKRYPPS